MTDAEADELVRADWRPSVRRSGCWDGPCGKIKGALPGYALWRMRRDEHREAGGSPQTVREDTKR